MLSDLQIERYSRQIILPQVGGKGQETLLRSRVLVNGNGLLQTASLLYLAVAGVGKVGVLSKLRPALLSSLVDFVDLNPDCQVVMHDETETGDLKQLVQNYDVVLSHPEARLHAACYEVGRPFLCAAMTNAQGWLFSSLGYQSDWPCLQCLPLQFSENPLDSFVGEAFSTFDSNIAANFSASCSPMSMFFGALQATEALKLLLGLHKTSARKLWQCHFTPLRFSEHLIEKQPQCPLCGKSSL
jgi:molybdopterin/thiamine biosynthesis adenylyltransferase